MTLSKEKRQQLLMTIFGGLVILGASYYFGFRWINDARALTDQKAKTLAEKVEKAKKTVEAGELAQRHIQAIENIIRPFRDEMPRDQAQKAETWLTQAIYQVASRHKLTLKSSRMMDNDPLILVEFKDVPQFGVQSYGFNVQGNYFQLGEFLADLEASHPFMVVETIALSAGGGGAPNVHDMAVKVSMVTQKK